MKVKRSLKVKTVIVVVILTVVLSAVSLLIGSMLHRNMIRKEYEKDTGRLADSVAVMLESSDAEACMDQVEKAYKEIPADLMEAYKDVYDSLFLSDETGDEFIFERFDEVSGEYESRFQSAVTPQFLKVQGQLQQILDKNDLLEISVCMVDNEQDQLYRVFQVWKYEDPDMFVPGTWETMLMIFNRDSFFDYLHEGSNGLFSTHYGDPSNKGTIFTSVAPYYDKDTGEVTAYVLITTLWDEVIDHEKALISQ